MSKFICIIQCDRHQTSAFRWKCSQSSFWLMRFGPLKLQWIFRKVVILLENDAMDNNNDNDQMINANVHSGLSFRRMVSHPSAPYHFRISPLFFSCGEWMSVGHLSPGLFLDVPSRFNSWSTNGETIQFHSHRSQQLIHTHAVFERRTGTKGEKWMLLCPALSPMNIYYYNIVMPRAYICRWRSNCVFVCVGMCFVWRGVG